MTENSQQRPIALVFIVIYTLIGAVFGAFTGLLGIFAIAIARHSTSVSLAFLTLVDIGLTILSFLCCYGMWTRQNWALVWSIRFYWLTVVIGVAFDVLNAPDTAGGWLYRIGSLALDIVALACLYRSDIKAYLVIPPPTPEATPLQTGDSSGA